MNRELLELLEALEMELEFLSENTPGLPKERMAEALIKKCFFYRNMK